jgi:hypothetical protein
MVNAVRAALVQTEWTGDRDSMIKKHRREARSTRVPDREDADKA